MQNLEQNYLKKGKQIWLQTADANSSSTAILALKPLEARDESYTLHEPHTKNSDANSPADYLMRPAEKGIHNGDLSSLALTFSEKIQQRAAARDDGKHDIGFVM